MRLILAILLTLSDVAAPPLFRAQNVAATAATNVLDGFTHYWLADDIAGVDGDPVGTWPDGIVEDYTDPEFPRAKLEALGLKTKTSTMI